MEDIYNTSCKSRLHFRNYFFLASGKKYIPVPKHAAKKGGIADRASQAHRKQAEHLSAATGLGMKRNRS
jgi:hypothetical protein